MKNTSKFLKTLWKDESGQGLSEYALLLAVVLALALLFRNQIFGALNAKLSDLSSGITGFTGSPNE